MKGELGAKALQRWGVWTTSAVILSGAGAFVVGGYLDPPTVTGTATANPAGVVKAAAERKAADDAAAAEQKKADDDAALALLEDEVLQSMRDYFNDPANDFHDERIVIKSVALVNTADKTYEGMARMSAQGGTEHDVKVHVTADDRNVMWNTDPGALLPLFR
jgi:hypothetical protein